MSQKFFKVVGGPDAMAECQFGCRPTADVNSYRVCYEPCTVLRSFLYG